jgi:hypothetical protein
MPPALAFTLTALGLTAIPAAPRDACTGSRHAAPFRAGGDPHLADAVLAAGGMLFVNSGYISLIGRPGNVLLAFGVD